MEDTITNLFEERDRAPETAEEKPVEPAVDPEKPESDKSDKPDKPEVPEVKALQEELEKTHKRITDTQKQNHQNARKLKSALQRTQSLVESGALSEEEAKSLLESLETDMPLEEETPSHPFAKVLKIANAELDNIRKYNDDELLDDKVKAFDYFLNMAPSEEVKEALEELQDLSDDPVKLAKKMLSIGKRYYDESYKDIVENGGFQGLITKKNQEIDKLNKSIDKLTKKLAQYEDYDQPRHRINELGESGSNSVTKGTMDSLFEERDKVKRR
jgi:hypothetical protein